MTKEEAKYTTLDTEQCKWWANHLFNIAKEKAFNSHNFDDAEEIQSAQDKIIIALEQEPKCRDCVSRDYLLSIANKDGAYGYVSAHEIIKAPSVNPQEPKTDVLDKIRAEIDALQSDAFYNKRMILEIIDKYKAESEEV